MLKPDISFLIGVVLLCFLYSCHTSSDRMLHSAEAYMTTRPDTSLAILSQIDPELLKTNRQKARFALLKSIAMDKTYLDETNDSLIGIAAAYYATTRNEEMKMKAWYYQGIVRKNAGAFPSAMVSFEQAKQAAERIQDSHYLGLIYRNTASILQQSGNVPEAIVNMRLALAAFEQNDESLYANYAKYTLAGYLLTNLEFDEARLLFHELRTKSSSNRMQMGTMLCLADSYISKGDSVSSAITIYRSIPAEDLGAYDLSNYALALAMDGDYSSADSILNIIYNRDLSPDDVVRVNYRTATIDSLNRRYRVAYQKVRHAALAQDAFTRESLQQSMTAMQRDYYKKEVALREETLRHKNTLTVLLSAFFIVLFSLIAFAVRNAQRRRESQLKEQMAQLVLSNRQSQKDRSNLVGTLFLEKISRLYHLSAAYYDIKNEYKEQYLVQFKQQLRELRTTPELFINLEKDLNQYSSHIMERFREQVPLNERQYHATALFFAGIPDECIQLILGVNSLASLRTYRTRIRSEIKAVAPMDEQLFLELLIVEKQPREKTKE